MDDLLETAAEEHARHVLHWACDRSGLRAFCVIDSVDLGPAAGGIRTQPYPSRRQALRDATLLARAMSTKCALAGLAAGGGKIVVLEHPSMNRTLAFEELGRRIEDLGGLFRAGGDLGTRGEDLAVLARTTRFINVASDAITRAVARGVMRCLEACVATRGNGSLSGTRIAIQGCGAVGAALARALHAVGAGLVLADTDGPRARALAEETNATVVPPEDILSADVDIVSPCAVGGTLTALRADGVRAFAICGGANNILSEPSVAERLQARSVIFVPDVVSSAGGVIYGFGTDVMRLVTPEVMIDALGTRAAELLDEAKRSGRTPSAVAQALADSQLARARAERAARIPR